MNFIDPYLRMEEVAPDGWNQEFIRRANLMFPRLTGGHVADILCILHVHDTFVGQVESLWETHEDAFAPYQSGDVHIALIYACVVAMDCRSIVYKLARKAEPKDAA
jgi:hypothetical protein